MGFYGVFGKIQRHLSAYTKGAALLPLRVQNICRKEIKMNRLRKCTFLLFVIVGLTGLLGCNKVATKTTAASLPETMSDHTYQAVYTSLDADLIFADGETLLAEKNGQKAIYENGELTENSEDDVIAMIRWQGNFYYLREQNNTAFLEIPSGMQITLEKVSQTACSVVK